MVNSNLLEEIVDSLVIRGNMIKSISELIYYYYII